MPQDLERAELHFLCTEILRQAPPQVAFQLVPSAMDRFVTKNQTLRVNVADRLRQTLAENKLDQELQDAIVFLTDALKNKAPFHALGQAAPALASTVILQKLREQEQKCVSAPYVLFSGTLAMLDLQARCQPIQNMDLAKMKYMCEQLVASGDVNKVLGTIPVQAETMAEDLTGLRRVEGDAEVDSLTLAIYWNRDHNLDEFLEACRNITMSAQRVGTGLTMQIERLERIELQDQKRKSMGKSTFQKAKLLLALVEEAKQSPASGVDLTQTDGSIADSLLSRSAALKESWKRDTCVRYLQIADRTKEPKYTKLFRDWEYHKGRDALCDGFAVLRACCVATSTSDELYTLLETLFYEQMCKMRHQIKARSSRNGHAELVSTMRGLILRHNFFQYARISFPLLKETLERYGTWKYYNEKYGITEGGFVPGEAQDDTREEMSEEEEKDEEMVTRFESKRQLVGLLDLCSKNKFEPSFRAASRDAQTGYLDLTSEALKMLATKLQYINQQYQKDFPPKAAPGLQDVSNTASGSMEALGAVQINDKVIETVEQYQEMLSEYNASCKKLEADEIDAFLRVQIIPIVSDIDSCALLRKFGSVRLLSEPGRKLWLQDLLSSKPVNWAKAKASHKRLRTLTCSDVCFQQGERDKDSGDTLRPLKSVYTQYRSTKHEDGMSDDILAVLIPGETKDKPINEALERCYKSLKMMVPKHHDPKIGSIEMEQADMTALNRQLFARKVQHHFLFTYQCPPDANKTRKKMRYLGGGHSAVNIWPVADTPWPQRLQTTQEEHDKIFEGAVALESGDEGTFSEQSTHLGDKVVPFPFELNRCFVQEVLHIWDIKVAVFLEVGSGECLMACILEKTRSVAVFKSYAHKKVVFARLAEMVKNHRLVSITLPEKPVAMRNWEASHHTRRPAIPAPTVPQEAEEPPNLPVLSRPVPAQPTSAELLSTHPSEPFAALAPNPGVVRPRAFAAFGASPLNTL